MVSATPQDKNITRELLFFQKNFVLEVSGVMVSAKLQDKNPTRDLFFSQKNFVWEVSGVRVSLLHKIKIL